MSKLLDEEHEMFKLESRIKKDKEIVRKEKERLVLSKKEHEKKVVIDFPLNCEELESIRYHSNHCQTLECKDLENVGDRFERYLVDLHKTCSPSVMKDNELKHSIAQHEGYIQYHEKELEEMKLELKKKK